MINKRELSEKIRTLRKEKGLLQPDLAEKAGVSIRVVRDLEGATGNPTLESLDLVVAVLGVSLSEILMPGMEVPKFEIINAPESVKGEGANDENQEANPRVSIRGFGEPDPNAKRDKQSHSQAGEPPHEMSEEINKVSHAPSSALNTNNFSANQASLILEVQSLLTSMDESQLETLKMTAEGLIQLKQPGNMKKVKE